MAGKLKAMNVRMQALSIDQIKLLCPYKRHPRI
jgi:hypothetical protein